VLRDARGGSFDHAAHHDSLVSREARTLGYNKPMQGEGESGSLQCWGDGTQDLGLHRKTGFYPGDSNAKTGGHPPAGRAGLTSISRRSCAHSQPRVLPPRLSVSLCLCVYPPFLTPPVSAPPPPTPLVQACRAWPVGVL
jgi:hypothetical protein